MKNVQVLQYLKWTADFRKLCQNFLCQIKC